jgi:DNA-binding transcriptional MocR family regulator
VGGRRGFPEEDFMLLHIDRRGKDPVYKQICRQVARLVDEGTLDPGSHLPATRVMASRLGVHRTTVYRAYQELWALGYLESRPGSYSTVRARVKPAGALARTEGGLIDWEAVSPPSSRRIFQDLANLPRSQPRRGAPETIHFSGLSADRELSPVGDLRRVLREVLSRDGKAVLDYADPQGFLPLRQVIARRMRIHGVTVGPEEILVTHGSQHGLDLVLRLLTRPNASIAVESPTYSMAIPLFRFLGLKQREIPMRADGLDLGALGRSLAAARPALLYTIPNFHNPTGITTSQAHREELLALCERHRMPLVEDGFEEEMKYFGRAVLPIKSMDSRGAVIYLGTFSKVMFPGLRIGWIAAEGGCTQRLLAVNRFSHLSGSHLAQAAVARFCEEGHYEQGLRRIHKAYRKRMLAMLRGMREHFPEKGVTWTEPAGGYTLWVELPGLKGTEEALLEHLAREGVAVCPGSQFYSSRPPHLSFRLSVSNLDEERIEEGCRRVGRALAKALKS